MKRRNQWKDIIEAKIKPELLENIFEKMNFQILNYIVNIYIECLFEHFNYNN